MSVVAVILAAGAGRRLGGVAKALLLEQGQSFLERIAGLLQGSGRPVAVAGVVVVGPPFQAAVASEAERLGLVVVSNPAPERGMASSVAIGFAAAEQWYPQALGGLLWPVDHARVRAQTVAEVINQGTAGGIVIPTYGGRGGHPTWFGQQLWSELAGCASAPDGARSVRRAQPARVTRWDARDPGVLADVDYPEDLR